MFLNLNKCCGIVCGLTFLGDSSTTRKISSNVKKRKKSGCTKKIALFFVQQLTLVNLYCKVFSEIDSYEQLVEYGLIVLADEFQTIKYFTFYISEQEALWDLQNTSYFEVLY